MNTTLVVEVIFVILIGILSVVLIRTVTFSSKQTSVPKVEHAKTDESRAVEHLSKGIQFKTISNDDPSQNEYNNWILLRDYIDVQYPSIHNQLKRTILNEYSLLYEWRGAHPDKKPIILTAHLDVVPANTSDWQVDPFEGSTRNGVIWGRGAIDDKGSLFSILEAVEYLLESGYVPERTIYLAFGHDEEAGTTGGMNGARKIAEHLKNEGVQAEFVLDEGGLIVDKDASPVKGQKFALIGIAEKGVITLRITASEPGGHAAMPGEDTAIGLLAKALTDLEQQKMISSMNGVVGLTFDYLGPEMPFAQKMLFANRWLLGNLIMSKLEKNRILAAMLHTTVAPTIIQGGSKESALPESATVLINFRIIPGETSKDVINHVKNSFSDPRIKVEQFGTVVHEPSSVSSLNSRSFQVITRTIREVFPDVMVAPVLVTGRTDSIYYRKVVENTLRFAPYLEGLDALKQAHGIDERISVASYLDMIQFYIRFIQNSAEA
jgi:carboxypeptidase PM20D1